MIQNIFFCFHAAKQFWAICNILVLLWCFVDWCLIMKNSQKIFFQKPTQMSIIKTCKNVSNHFHITRIVLSTNITCRAQLTRKHLKCITSRLCIQLQTIFTDILQTCLKVSLHNSKYLLNCFSVVEQHSFSNGTWIDTTPKQWYNHCAQIELLLEKHFQNVEIKH